MIAVRFRLKRRLRRLGLGCSMRALQNMIDEFRGINGHRSGIA